ncbi:MAG TPA: ATP-grasp domain-containing protein [Planctomycetota bacterium]|nr:ATP-grasp domain-containing protein [Planctomycetota bacterium]
MGAVRALGLKWVLIPVEDILASRERIRSADLVIEHADTYRGRGDLRPLVRHWIEAWGGRLAGAPAAAAQVADDKIEAQARLKDAGLRVPRSRVLDPMSVDGARGLRFPLVLKEPFEHGSRGVKLARTRKALGAWRRRSRAAGVVLAEEFVEGREIAVSVVEVNGHPRALPAVEVLLEARGIYSPRIKWGPGALPIAPARLDLRGAQRVASACLRAFEVLRLRDYARFDLRLGAGGEPCFLEANARPSVEEGTELRLAAELVRIPFPDLLLEILRNAARRHGDRALLRRLPPGRTRVSRTRRRP